MWIEKVRHITQASFRRELRSMSDGQLIGQEISQKGAMHVLQFLLREGVVTEQRVREILESLGRQAQWLTAECKRRRLPTVDDPRGN